MNTVKEIISTLTPEDKEEFIEVACHLFMQECQGNTTHFCDIFDDLFRDKDQDTKIRIRKAYQALQRLANE